MLLRKSLWLTKTMTTMLLITMRREPTVLRSLYDENVESHYHAHRSDGYVKPRSYHCA